MSLPSPPPASPEKKRPKPGMLKRLFSSRLLNIADLSLDDPPTSTSTSKRKQKKLTRSRTCDTININRSNSTDMSADKTHRRHGSVTGVPQRQHSAPTGHPVHRSSKPEVRLQRGQAVSEPGMDDGGAIAEEDEDETGKKLLRPEDGDEKTSSRNSSFSRRVRKKKLAKSVSDAKLKEPIEYPCVPELMLEHHKREPFLSATEEWLLVELNEYECLIDKLQVVQLMAKHSKFFEVEPPELVEEFFLYVDMMPSYDEVINLDTWQEFRDKKYLC
ncbi:hypothetical protein NP493_732g02035 [Ridgeia piscesae]|uniref:Uncharacterized protein n=1 Tax=Ridgeia piscesae TaxID=27915 RepID=A0AAD9NQ70_RIDPI|nr:hypothetical protein NP493_732g02035 [Ridgeia piscesae]